MFNVFMIFYAHSHFQYFSFEKSDGNRMCTKKAKVRESEAIHQLITLLDTFFTRFFFICV